MGIKLFAILVSMLLLLSTLDFVRRGKLTFKYAFGWIALSGLAIFFVVFDSYLFDLSRMLGFVLPSNFVFFVLLAFFAFLSLFLTVFLCQQDSRNDTMAQKIGILEMEMEDLKKRADKQA